MAFGRAYPSLMRARRAVTLPSEPPPAETEAQAPTAGGWRRDALIAGLLALLVLVTLLAAGPLPRIPLNDSVSYARTAKALADQGHIAYNGWGSPMLLPQALYGALVIKIAGFNHTALAATGIVFALLSTFLMYFVTRACGASPLPAALATAALTLNPIFLSSAPSFMNDIPSLFLLLLALWLLLRSIASSDSGTLALDRKRFFAALAVGILAGANRQVSWVAFLAALAVAIVYLRSDRRVLLIGTGILLVIAAAMTAWLDRQPYIIPTDVTQGLLIAVGYPNIVLMMVYRLLNMMGLFLLPLAVLAIRGKRINPVTMVAAAVLALPPVFYAFGTTMPMLGDLYRFPVEGQYFTSSGVMVGGVDGFGNRPVIFSPAIVAALVLAGAVGLALTLYVLFDLVGSLKRSDASVRFRYVAAALLAATTVAQIVVSLPWYALLNMFDRYLLLLLPGVLAALAVAVERRRVPLPALAAAVVLVGGMWLTGFGFAAEYLRATAVRSTLYHRLLEQNVPAQQIDGGFELLADTQIAAGGYVNHPGIRNPSDAYRKDVAAKYVTFGPQYWPAVDARYRLSTEPSPDPGQVDPVPVDRMSYTSPIFPPRERTMFVYRIRREGE